LEPDEGSRAAAARCRHALGGHPRELAESVDVVFSMLTNTEALEEVAGGDAGMLEALSSSKVWAGLSTIASDASIWWCP